MCLSVGTAITQSLEAARDVVKRRNGLLHGNRAIAHLNFFVQQSQFIPDELSIPATAT